MHVARNHIEVGDDGVSLKSGMDECGRKYGRPSNNVTIESNFFNFSGGVAFGSEMSGGISDVIVQHNTLRGGAPSDPSLFTWGPRVVSVKAPRGRGGVIENVKIFNTTCSDCDQIVRISMYDGTPLNAMINTPQVRNVTVERVRGTTEELGFFRTLPESPLGMNFLDVKVPLVQTAPIF